MVLHGELALNMLIAEMLGTCGKDIKELRHVSSPSMLSPIALHKK